MKKFEVFRVVGSGSVQQLLCQTIELPTPAEEIKEIRKTVIIDNCRVIYDKVIIDGRLRKDIEFKAADAGFPRPGTVQGCGGPLTTVSGPIEDIDVDIAFNALIPVKGACPDDECVVVEAFVEGEKEEPAGIQESGAFTALVDKSVVFICVKVIRDTITKFGHDDDHDGHDYDDEKPKKKKAKKKKDDKKKHDKKKSAKKKHDKDCHDDPCKREDHGLCPRRRSMGFHPTGRIPAPKPGPLPGSWVGPTLVFPGVLNPGIPATVPNANQIVNTTSTQVQITGRGR